MKGICHKRSRGRHFSPSVSETWIQKRSPIDYETKSRGTSLGTTLWRHVQRCCAQFRAFMVFYGNHIRWKNMRVYVQLLQTLIFNYTYSKGSLSTLTIICRCRPCALSTNETYKQNQLYKKACVYVRIEEQIFIQVESKGKRPRKYNSSNALICKFFIFWG